MHEKKEVKAIDKTIASLICPPRGELIKIFYRNKYVMRSRVWIARNLLTTADRKLLTKLRTKIISLKQKAKNKHKKYIVRCELVREAKALCEQREQLYLRYRNPKQKITPHIQPTCADVYIHKANECGN
jgi:hypothetical protein